MVLGFEGHNIPSNLIVSSCRHLWMLEIKVHHDSKIFKESFLNFVLFPPSRKEMISNNSTIFYFKGTGSPYGLSVVGGGGVEGGGVTKLSSSNNEK